MEFSSKQSLNMNPACLLANGLLLHFLASLGMLSPPVDQRSNVTPLAGMCIMSYHVSVQTECGRPVEALLYSATSGQNLHLELQAPKHERV